MTEVDKSKQLSQAKQEEFLEKIRGQIQGWVDEQGGYEYEELLKHAPDFFYLLHRLSSDERVDPEARSKMENAMFYFVLPMDVIPEGIMGPEGYADDVIISAKVLDDNLKSQKKNLIEEYWPSESDPQNIIETILELAEDWVGENRLKKIQDWIDENT